MRKVELLPTWDCEAGYGPVEDLNQTLTYIIHKPRRQATLAVRGPLSILIGVFR